MYHCNFLVLRGLDPTVEEAGLLFKTIKYFIGKIAVVLFLWTIMNSTIYSYDLKG